MKRTTKYVALDVHQATTVSSVRDETGRVITRTIIPTEAESLLAFARGMRGAVHVVFEEGTQAQWLSELLTPVVQSVVVCNRRGDTTTGNKSDQHDADELSDRLRLGRLRAVYHGRGDHARSSPTYLLERFRRAPPDWELWFLDNSRLPVRGARSISVRRPRLH